MSAIAYVWQRARVLKWELHEVASLALHFKYAAETLCFFSKGSMEVSRKSFVAFHFEITGSNNDWSFACEMTRMGKTECTKVFVVSIIAGE